MTGDDVERVDENRRPLCAAIGADPERLALNRQVHSTLVRRAEPGARGEPGDGLWTDEPGVPMLAHVRRLPADRARPHGRRAGGAPSCTPAGAVSSPGSSRGRRSALGGRLAAARRPGDRAVLLRGRRRGRRSLSRRLRRRRRPRRQARPLERGRARAARSRRRACRPRSTSARRCNPERFFSHRRDGRAARRPGSDRVLSPDGDPRAPASGSAARSARRDDRRGDEVRRRSRTWRVARRAGRRGRRGEPRPGPRGEARRATATRSAGTSSATCSRTRRRSSTRICELVHSLDSESAARRLEVPALVQVNLSGEASKSGVAPDELAALPRAYPTCAGCSTMPPAAADPEESRAVVPPAARARRRARPAGAVDGDDAGLPRRRRGGRDVRPCRIRSCLRR